VPDRLPAARAGASGVATPVAELVRRAAGGDQVAWDGLVDRFGGLVWNVARAHRLDSSDAADVCQTVWLRLVEHLARLRDPDALGGWLATTTRHEAVRVLRRGARELPDDDAAGWDQRPTTEPGPEIILLRAERRAMVWKAVSGLNSRCQLLLRALASAPEASYAEISRALEMPIGSIGPTRARCLEHLRRRLCDVGVISDEGGDR